MSASDIPFFFLDQMTLYLVRGLFANHSMRSMPSVSSLGSVDFRPNLLQIYSALLIK